MKKLIFILLILTLVSCDGEFQCTPQSVSGTWRTTHQEFTLEVNEVLPRSLWEALKEAREQHVSIRTSATPYILSFKGGGKGSGSGIRHDGNGRFDFGFEWELRDGILSYVETRSGYGGVFFTHDWTALSGVSWEIKMVTPQKMVLEMVMWANVDGTNAAWTETYTYRYTFERIN